MTPVIKNYIELFARCFPVEWDRYTTKGIDHNIYGWIKRKDGQRDFVLLQLYVENGQIKGGFVTSSAKYSRQISKYMFGEGKGHNRCIKIK